MSKYPLLLATFGIALSAVNAKAQKYGCEAGDKVGLGDVNGIGLRPLAAGFDPAISPDGSKIAYTRNDQAGNRAIAIVDTATGKVRPVSGIPGDNNYGPVWSPDGQFLYFNHFKNSDWTVARVNAAGGGFRIISDKSLAFAPLPDGRRLLCNDMSKFFILTIDGDKMRIGKALPKDPKFEGVSIPCRMDVAPDGATALFEMAVAADAVPAENEGMPPSSVWKIDLANGSLTRMTPKGTPALSPAWLPAGTEFLFGSIGKGGKMEIFRISTAAGSKPRQVAQNAMWPTVARDSSSGPGLTEAVASADERIDITADSPSVRWDVTIPAGQSKAYLINVKKGKTISASFLEDDRKGNVDLGKYSLQEGLPNAGGGVKFKSPETKDYRLVVQNPEQKPLVFTFYVTVE